ncbi:hypothetical protein [Erythrobacter sp. R86502]|uniref:hypothetical protein n=1 Tax=Erythrobacter sp. R86502 TaxID=3093846 RepID=UPI0036D250E9
MSNIKFALILSAAVMGVALLAVFDIVPEAVAQYAPLAVVPFIVSRQPACRAFGKGKAA